MRWKVLVVVALLAAIAPAQFTHVATVTVQAATGAVNELVGGHE
jgi:hypothetical protein